MATGTVRLHRVLRASTEKVYRAFLEADALSKWLSPHGFTCELQHLDAVVGGSFRMSFTHFSTGNSHLFGGTYQVLVSFERIRYSDTFNDPNLPGEMQVTVLLTPVSCGCELQVEQAGIPAVIALEMCYLGWQELLAQLANLVAHEIAA